MFEKGKKRDKVVKTASFAVGNEPWKNTTTTSFYL